MGIRLNSGGKQPPFFWRNMPSIKDESFVYAVLAIVDEIPEGMVATYGQIARLVGSDRNARLIGKILSRADSYGDFPCHRVVNSVGRLAPHFPEQAQRLYEEGVTFRSDGTVDLDRHQWPANSCSK